MTQVNGTTTATHTLTNTGQGPLAVSAVNVGARAGFTLDSHNCPTQLAAGASCSAVTRYSPTSLTTGSSTINFTTTVGVLSGTVNLPMPPSADITVTASGLSGTLGVGATGTITVQIRNASTVSGSPVVTVNPSITESVGLTLGTPVCGSPASGAACPGTLPPGGSVDYTVPFTISGAATTQARFTARADQTSVTTADPNLANNQATLAASIRGPLYLKHCYFASNRTTSPVNGTLALEHFFEQHIGDVQRDSRGRVRFGAYRMYNPLTGLQDGPNATYAIKGTNIGMLAGTGLINIQTNAGYGASPAGYGAVMPCLGVSGRPGDHHTYCSTGTLAQGWRLWRSSPSSAYSVHFVTAHSGGVLHSSAHSSQISGVSNSVGDFRLMWSEFSPSATCQVPGSTTYRSWAQ